MLEADKNVRVPPRYGMGPMQHAINQMEVGDSMFVPTFKPNSTIAMAHKCALRAGYTVITRQWTENEVKGVRVWRSG